MLVGITGSRVSRNSALREVYRPAGIVSSGSVLKDVLHKPPSSASRTLTFLSVYLSELRIAPVIYGRILQLNRTSFLACGHTRPCLSNLILMHCNPAFSPSGHAQQEFLGRK
jgi:hypothetical protein